MTKSSFETPEFLAEIASSVGYSAETGRFVWKDHYRLNTRVIGKEAGHTSIVDGYVYLRFRRKLVRAHRVAFALSFGRWPAGHIDHMNRDRADNRLCNLRECTVMENAQNKHCKAGRTGVVGVTNVSGYEGKKFIARIKIGKQNIHLGTFNSIEEAAKARLAAREKLHPFSQEAMLHV